MLPPLVKCYVPKGASTGKKVKNDNEFAKGQD